MISTSLARVADFVLEIIAQAPARAPQRRPGGPRSPLLRFLFSLGLFGLFAVALLDSSFVPLPIPGLTDIMLILMAARHTNWLALIAIATAGSAIGGYISYRVGRKGGMALLEKRVPPRIFHLITTWMERHGILSVALPAILPPPVPLTPFVLAAGALRLPERKFLPAFILARCARHAIAVGLGLRYGRNILRMWNRLSTAYATPILVATWTVIGVSCALAAWKLYKASKEIPAAQELVS